METLKEDPHCVEHLRWRDQPIRHRLADRIDKADVLRKWLTARLTEFDRHCIHFLCRGVVGFADCIALFRDAVDANTDCGWRPFAETGGVDERQDRAQVCHQRVKHGVGKEACTRVGFALVELGEDTGFPFYEGPGSLCGACEVAVEAGHFAPLVTGEVGRSE